MHDKSELTLHKPSHEQEGASTIASRQPPKTHPNPTRAVLAHLDTSTRVAAEYDVYEYTRQRIELIGLEIKSLFESDKSRQMGLLDFM